MDLEILKKSFDEHVKKFDLTDIGIYRKYEHSKRVMYYSYKIAKDNNFNEVDTEICIIAGLLHDYGRFEQWTKYHTYNDLESFDHAELGIKLLFEDGEIKKFTLNEDYYDVIYNAIKYHNKFEVPSNLSDNHKKIVNVIRDADKIDICDVLKQKLTFEEDNCSITKAIRDNFYNHKPIDWNLVKNNSDAIVLKLAIIYDLNYNYSYQYIYENNFLDNMFNVLIYKNLYHEYFEYIKKYIEKRLEEC